MKPIDSDPKGKKKEEVDLSIFKSTANYSSASIQEKTAKTKKAADTNTPFLDFSDVRNGDMSIVDDGSQMDGEFLRTHFTEAKQKFDELAMYVQVNRQALLEEATVKQQRSMAIAKSLEYLAPADCIHLQILISEQQDQAHEVHRIVKNLDGQVNNERSRLNQVLTYLLHSIPGMDLTRMVHELQWPTLSVCRDLDLPYDYQLMITGAYNPPHIVKDEQGKHKLQEKTESDELKLMQQRILLLESQLQRAQVNTQCHSGVNDHELQRTTLLKPENKENKAMNQQRVFLERRKRHKFPTFEKGSAHEAQQWMQRYEVLAKYLGFTEDKKSEEMTAVLTGDSMDWLIGLDPTSYKQGNKPMKEFGPGITTLLQRAGIYQANIQLDYLNDQLHPELEKAVIMNRAQTLADGIHIATEIERSLAKSKLSNTYMGPITNY
ncbi:uncharacterized protein EV154DRAFT_488335 [Mucor mucedo]|uniref:uncharacterized protein n=1 Tax=Mucor mucedo TaxID=29922 RepID=UPI002220C909|nr:uncharacterized protein EV154DRAFT_488335 [Mucor mucedo]KAI7867341.1 hypothetical protein EV154DRAFT_488335 [Mucor mucedo]